MCLKPYHLTPDLHEHAQAFLREQLDLLLLLEQQTSAPEVSDPSFPTTALIGPEGLGRICSGLFATRVSLTSNSPRSTIPIATIACCSGEDELICSLTTEMARQYVRVASTITSLLRVSWPRAIYPVPAALQYTADEQLLLITNIHLQIRHDRIGSTPRSLCRELGSQSRLPLFLGPGPSVVTKWWNRKDTAESSGAAASRIWSGNPGDCL
jgi:hypothetical protein